MTKKLNFVTVDDVETQVFDWGKLQWLSEPRITGSRNMTTGLVTLAPGKGHAKHNHPGCEEVLYVLKGTGEQTIWTDAGEVKKTVKVGDLIYLEADQYHSTINTGTEDMVLMAVYQFSGPEAAMRADPGCTIIPPKNP
jgi:Thermophilic glucose-6-phosphate isomerase and related metalloenzymes